MKWYRLWLFLTLSNKYIIKLKVLISSCYKKSFNKIINHIRAGGKGRGMGVISNIQK